MLSTSETSTTPRRVIRASKSGGGGLPPVRPASASRGLSWGIGGGSIMGVTG